ncbi:MAG: hypothetical protein ABR507_05065 [Actinomycetota bacterium]|nr:hypothetical protein [Actinomycetota bacterium]
MGLILKEEYICDYCGKPITGGDVLVARLALRRQGARGLGRDFSLAFHPACSEKLTKYASPAPRQRRASSEQQVEETA